MKVSNTTVNDCQPEQISEVLNLNVTKSDLIKVAVDSIAKDVFTFATDSSNALTALFTFALYSQLPAVNYYDIAKSLMTIFQGDKPADPA